MIDKVTGITSRVGVGFDKDKGEGISLYLNPGVIIEYMQVHKGSDFALILYPDDASTD
jgi:hypothetical protein